MASPFSTERYFITSTPLKVVPSKVAHMYFINFIFYIEADSLIALLGLRFKLQFGGVVMWYRTQSGAFTRRRALDELPASSFLPFTALLFPFTAFLRGGGGGGNGVEIGSVYEGSLCPKILSSRGMAPMTVSLYCENPRTRFSRSFESEDSSKNVGQWPYGPSCCL